MPAARISAAAVLALAALCALAPWPIEAAEVAPPARTIEPAGGEALRASAASSPSRARPTGALEVLAVRRADRAPVASLWIRVRAFDEEAAPFEPRLALTGGDGLARFEDLPAGDVVVETDRGGEGLALVRARAARRKTILVEPGVALSGRVVDPAGAAVRGAEVWLSPDADFASGFPVTASDASGRFAIADVVPGARRVAARHGDHAPSASLPLDTRPGETQELVLRLGAGAGSLAGRVLARDGAPIAGAEVLVGPCDAQEAATSCDAPPVPAGAMVATTDARGAFELRGLRAGASWVAARARGYLAGAASVSVSVDERAQVEVALERAAAIEGFVRRAGGEPARNARIVARSTVAREERTSRTALDGGFRVEGLPPGEVRLLAEWGDEEWGATSLELSAGENRRELALERGRSLGGRVLDERGEAVAGVVVELARAADDAEPFLRVATTGPDGRFLLRGAADREHVLRVLAAGARGAPLLEVGGVRPSGADLGGAGLELRLDPRSRPSVRIVGRVTTADGAAPARATILPFRGGSGCVPERAQAELVGADGSIDVGPLVAGEWGCVIECEGFAPRAEPARPLAPDAVWDLGEVVLARGETLAVRFVLPEGGVRPPLLVARGLDAPIESWLAVDGGVARSAPLAPGRYRVACESPRDLAADVRDVELRAGGTEIEFPLRRGVDVVLRAPAGAGGTLRVLDAQGRALVERALASDAGERGLSLCLAPGAYRWEATCGGRELSGSFEVAGAAHGATVDVTPD